MDPIQQKNTNAIPAPLLDLMVKLNFLGMIERGKKINWCSLSFSDSNSYLGALYRSTYGENRKGLIFHLSQIIDQSIRALEAYNNTTFCEIIINSMAKAKNGIQNLKTTYQKDPFVVSQIEACISNIDMQLEKNKHLLKGVKENKAT
jgi:hypothetical protein